MGDRASSLSSDNAPDAVANLCLCSHVAVYWSVGGGAMMGLGTAEVLRRRAADYILIECSLSLAVSA